MKVIFNPSPTSPVTVKSDAFGLPRFSNDDAVSAGQGLGTNTEGSGAFNYGMIGDWLNTGASIVNSIWGTSDRYMANMYQSMYNEEKKTTNLMIGIVVVVVLLAIVFLIIKKK